MEWVKDAAIAVLPLVALLLAAMLRGAVSAVVRYLEGRFAVDLEAEHEATLLRLVDDAVAWVQHKMPAAGGNQQTREAKLQKAMALVRGEIVARGLTTSLERWTDRRLAMLIEARVARAKGLSP